MCSQMHINVPATTLFPPHFSEAMAASVPLQRVIIRTAFTFCCFGSGWCFWQGRVEVSLQTYFIWNADSLTKKMPATAWWCSLQNISGLFLLWKSSCSPSPLVALQFHCWVCVGKSPQHMTLVLVTHCKAGIKLRKGVCLMCKTYTWL